jgi:hypothetical protein
MGLVVDTVYGEPETVTIENDLRKWTRIQTNRVYSDEVNIGRGLFAFNRCLEMFKKNNFAGMNAWRALI